MRILNHCVAVLGAGMTLAGCASDTKQPYPDSPPSAKQPMQSPDMQPAPMPAPSAPGAMKVPPSAVELSHGEYPPPAFPTPDKPGLILVVDMDVDPTTSVAATRVTGQDAGKMMSITDIANMSVTMNKLHKFKIVYVPSVSGMTTGQ